MSANNVYTSEQIASVYFDSRRDLKPSTEAEPFSWKKLLSYFNDNNAKPLPIDSADIYLSTLGFKEETVKAFRSHADQSVINSLKRQNPKHAILCDFDSNHYLGLRLDKKCFSLDPATVKDMRKSFVQSLNAGEPKHLKTFSTDGHDGQCRPLQHRLMEVA